MMKIKLTDIKDQTIGAYLDKNPEYANKLVATLNRVDGLDPNQLTFYADSHYGTYDCGFSPNYEINKETFAILNDQIRIQSRNRDDLLNPHYYQHLNHLANNHPIEKGIGNYFAQDQVLQLESLYQFKPDLNIKLTKSIDQYSQNQLNAMGKLITNVYDFIIKDDELDGKQFDNQGKQAFDLDKVQSVGIVFNLNDVINPKILIRGKYKNNDNQYLNNDLKQVLKADAPLLKFLNNNNNFQADFQPYQSKANKFFKRFLD